MDRDQRKAAAAACKERKPAAGIYAVRCGATAQCWVGAAADLATIRNRLWFTLRHGSNPHRSLQDAWRRHGAEAFSFQRLEQLDDDLAGTARTRALKDRLAHWRGKLAAESI